MSQIEKDIKKLIYSKDISPNEIIWLLLGLPIKNKNEGNSKKYLKLNIAEIILFGFGNSGINLKTNSDGYITWNLTSNEKCLNKSSLFESSIVAYEKESCLKLIPKQGNNPEHYIFEGNYSVGLTKSNYERTIAQVYKELYVVQRQFRLQYHVLLKHQKYHRFAFKRVVYQLNGKTNVISVRSLDPVTEKFENLPQNTYDKPWKQNKNISESKLSKKKSNKKIKEDYGNKDNILFTKESIYNNNNKSNNTNNTNQVIRNELSPTPESQLLSQNIIRNDDDIQMEVVKRTLKPLIPNNSIVIDIPLTSAPTLLELTLRVANHLSGVLKRQVTNLILDFVKNSSDEYVLIEILGFQFNGYGIDTIDDNDDNLSSMKVFKLPSKIKNKIEHFYRCRLNGTKFQNTKNNNNGNNNGNNNNNNNSNNNNHMNNHHESETDSLNDDSDLESYTDESDDENNENDQLDKKGLSEAITPQTLTCRMCTRKITPGSIRYLLTSVMIQSTVVHLRSRLSYDELPEFCRDRSTIMKTMQRLDDVSSSLCPPKLDVTEADLVTCETCYALYKGESHLMEIEHQLARFTRTSGLNSVKFDARNAITKPLKKQNEDIKTLQNTTPITPSPTAIIPRRQSVQGVNILSRPTSAPILTPNSRLPLTSKSNSNISTNSNTNINTNSNSNSYPLLISNTNLRSLNKLLSKSNSNLIPEVTLLSSTNIPTTPIIHPKKETLLRDTFRAKNSPTRTLSKDFYQTASPLKRSQSTQSETNDKKDKNNLNHQGYDNSSLIQDNLQEYPPVSSIPFGRRVTRSDLVTQQFTLCRMMIALHKVTDLPVIFLDAYENFKICYISLGRRRDATCMKNFTFTRNRANRFKNRNLMRTNTKIGRVLEGIDESNSDSNTSSSHGSSLCSDPSSGFSSEEEDDDEEKEKENINKKDDKNKSNDNDDDNDDGSNNDDDNNTNESNSSKKNQTNNNNQRKDSKTTPRKKDNNNIDNSYPITRKTSLVIQKENEKRKIEKLHSKSSEEDDDDDENDDDDEMDHDETEICVGALDVKYMRMSYFMVPGDAQDESNNFYNNFVTKSGRILVVLCAQLKRNAVIDERHWIIPDETKTSKAKAYKLRKEIYAIRKSALNKSSSKNKLKDFPEEKFIYDPRSDNHKITDTGDFLPSDAIGYAYISIDQLKCNAVKRLDLGVPLTYAIKHLPKERSVPMLRAMVGIDRPVYPIDNWSLPYSLVELYHEKNLYVAEFEEQFTSTVPLPPEWLNVDIEKSAQRRQPLTQTCKVDQGNDEIDYSEKLNTLVRAQIAADIDGHKRAPTLYVSAGRVERMTMASQQQPIVKLEGIVDTEQKMERMDSSVWCLCIQVMQARHLSSKENIFSENRPIWICSYNFFGEIICIKGELLHDDFDEGVIYFGSTSKHLFKGSIDAVEAMFQNNPPIIFDVEIVHLPQKSNTFTSGNMLASKSLLLDLSSEINSATNLQKLNKNKSLEEKKSMSGSLQLDIQEERFIDVTIQLQPKYIESNSSNFSLYPPYLNINVKLFRMGPHEESAQYNWLPPQTKLGDIISKYVTRVIAVEFGSKTSSNQG